MGGVNKMAKFVGNHVVNAGGRCQHQLRLQVNDAFWRPTSPAFRHSPQPNFGGADTAMEAWQTFGKAPCKPLLCMNLVPLLHRAPDTQVVSPAGRLNPD